jgi:hypothetical protein
MGKKLAIIGHPTRGNEVIKLLEMVGGKNCYNLSGLFTDYGYYFIGGPHNDGICGVEYIFSNEDICLFTLEEFFEKYPFKVGDKVVYTKFGDNCDEYPVTIESMKWTGATIEYTFNDCVTCLAKDLKMWDGEPDEVISGIYLNSCDYADEVELNLGDYEIEVRDGKTYAVKKKPKYPKNCSECENVLGIQDTIIAGCLGYEYRLMNNFQRLFMCRNAYWKIAGEQMGLGKPWEPNWTTFEGIPAIFRFRYNIVCDSVKDQHCLLVFPTTEMRDAFYENFRDLIESCKELL